MNLHKICQQNAKAQTVVKMSGNGGQISELQVKNLDEVKSRSEPQKKPQVVQIINQRMVYQDHCKLLQLKNKLQGKAATHSEKLVWWIISMGDCVTILPYTSVKWLLNPPLK